MANELIERAEALLLRHLYVLAAFSGCVACYLLHRIGYNALALVGLSVLLISAGDRLDDERAALRAKDSQHGLR